MLLPCRRATKTAHDTNHASQGLHPCFAKHKKQRGCVKTPNINKKNSLYVLVWMYNEFLFFYKKEPYKQFIWRYIGQISPQIREKSSLGHFCHHFLYIKGNGKEGKVHFDLVYTDMAKTTIRHVVFNLSENSFWFNTSFASMP